MSRRLNGIYWTPGSYELRLPYIGDGKKACRIYKQNLVPIAWNLMRTLENNPATLSQTATILFGQSVGGISIFNQMQVKNYGDGAKLLMELLMKDRFSLTKETACLLHSLVAREEALEWGILRKTDVCLGSVKFTPPTRTLENIIDDGLDYLGDEILNPIERAVGVFLFMSRNQPFYDANKRTASLLMNGCLMQAGYFPITILEKKSEEFHGKLAEFYEYGNADPMFAFFEKILEELYTKEQRKDYPHDSNL